MRRTLTGILVFLLGVSSRDCSATSRAVQFRPEPTVLLRVEPTYPVEAWWVADGDNVRLYATVDETGRITKIDPNQGSPKFSRLATAALRRWQFAPAVSNGSPIRTTSEVWFDFEPEEAVYFPDENRIISCAPQPIISYPFECPSHPDSTLLSRGGDWIALHIDKKGFVVETRFMTPAPPDSIAIKRSARRSVFRAFVALDGPRAGKPVSVWTAVHIYRCDRYSRALIARPDSVMKLVLHGTGGTDVAMLGPSRRDSMMIGGSISASDKPSQIGSSDILNLRPGSDSLRTMVREILESEEAYKGPDPIARRRIPEPEYAIFLNAKYGWLRLNVTISRTAQLIVARTDESILYVPYHAVRDKVDALIRALR
jgi:hypothetical protein